MNTVCRRCPKCNRECSRPVGHSGPQHNHKKFRRDPKHAWYGEVENITVNHPPHYNTGNIEVIDFIEDKELGFHLGNVVKYICRESKGNYLEDLEKAQWYLDREVTRRKKRR